MGGKTRQQTTNTAPWSPSQPYLLSGMSGARDLVFGPAMQYQVTGDRNAVQPTGGPAGGGRPLMSLANLAGGGAGGAGGMAPGVGGGGGSVVIPEMGAGIKRALRMAGTRFDPSGYNTARDSVMDVLNDSDVSRQFDVGYSQLRQNLDSQFARAGRYGSDAHANVMADAGADLMAGLQDANAARRMDAAGRLTAIEGARTDARNNYIDRSLALGEYGNNWDYDQGMRRLQDYMGLIQGTGGMGGTSSTPQYRNGLAGALGGAATGASLASTLGATALGPWAALGGLAGLL